LNGAVLRCVSNAAIELWKELPKAVEKPAASAGAGAGAAPAVTSGDIFRAIGTFVLANPATAEKAKTNFLFKLSGPESTWTIDLTTPPGVVKEVKVEITNDPLKLIKEVRFHLLLDTTLDRVAGHCTAQHARGRCNIRPGTFGQLVDVGCRHAAANASSVRPKIPVAGVVGDDEEDIWFSSLRLSRSEDAEECRGGCQ